MAKIKEVSSYNGTSWDTPIPIGANDANIDITSSTENPTDTTATSAGLVDSNVTVTSGDTAASAWTKFNRFRKRVQNAFGNFAGVTLRTAYNTSNTSTSVYTTGVINNYMSNVIGYTGTTAPSAGTVAAQLSSLNSNLDTVNSNLNSLYLYSFTPIITTTGELQATINQINFSYSINSFMAMIRGRFYITFSNSSQKAGNIVISHPERVQSKINRGGQGVGPTGFVIGPAAGIWSIRTDNNLESYIQYSAGSNTNVPGSWTAPNGWWLVCFILLFN